MLLVSEDPNYKDDIDGLAQDCSNFSALALELLQSWAKPSRWSHDFLYKEYTYICKECLYI